MPKHTTPGGASFEIFWAGDYDFRVDGVQPTSGWFWWPRAFGEAHGPFKNQNAAEADAQDVLDN